MDEAKQIRCKYDMKEKGNKLNLKSNDLYENGIDYTNTIQIQDIFIKEDLKLIGVDGCYLLFYLIVHAENKEYLKTTIGIIQSDIDMSKDKISNAIRILLTHRIINIKALKSFTKDIGVNDVLQIVILYGNNILYRSNSRDNNEDYKNIPIDYIAHTLIELSSMELAVLLCLILKFKYYLPVVQDEFNKPFCTYSAHEYTDTSLDQIADYIKSTRKTIKKNIDALVKKKYISYEPNEEGGIAKKLDEETGEYYSVSANYLYRVSLLQRIEYMYYNYYLSDLCEDILEKDYVKYTYNNEMNLMDRITKNKNIKLYNEINKVIIQNFSNKDVKNVKNVTKVKSISSLTKNVSINNYVYVLQMSGMEDTYKIGKTIDFNKRVGEYTKLPILPKLIKLIQVQDCSKVEAYFHMKFKEQRLRGEWFKLSEGILKYFVDTEYIDDIGAEFINEVDYKIKK